MACEFSQIMPLSQWIGVDDAMIIFITSIYHLYPSWYFTTIYAKTVGNATLLHEMNIFYHSYSSVPF